MIQQPSNVIISKGLVDPGELDGPAIANLILLNFYCRVQLPDAAQGAQRALLLFLMNSIYQEFASPTSLQEYVNQVQNAIVSDTEQAQIIVTYLEKSLEILDVPDGLTKLFNEKLSRMLPSYDPSGALNSSEVFLERRSFFGMYFRRIKLVFDSFDLEARNSLTEACLSWRDGKANTKEQQMSQLYQLPDEESDERILAYERYRLGLEQGNYTLARDNMQKFFDFFAPGADHELHQHTLLHLAAFHYETGSTRSSRAALDEAISLARSANDSECIAACESLMSRLKGQGTGLDPISTHGAQGRTRLRNSQDALWTACIGTMKGEQLVHVLQRLEDDFAPQPCTSQGQAVSNEISLTLMQDAKRRFGKDSMRPEAEIARLWDNLGQCELAQVYTERISKNKDDISIDRSASINALCLEASRLAKLGHYKEALAKLLDLQTVSLINFRQYHTWCEAVWEILLLRAERREEKSTLKTLAQFNPNSRYTLRDEDIEDLIETPKALKEVLDEQRKNSPWKETESTFWRRDDLTMKDKIQALLDKAEKMMPHNPTLAVSPVLNAIAIAKRDNYSSLHHDGIIRLSEILGIHMGMPDHACTMLEEVLPSILVDNDVEVRAKAKWVYAQCLLARCGDAKQDKDVRRALDWMKEAEKDADTASLIGLQRTILYYMARLYHHLDETDKRDEASSKQSQCEKEWIKATESQCEESQRMLEDTISTLNKVGAMVTCGPGQLELPSMDQDASRSLPF